MVNVLFVLNFILMQSPPIEVQDGDSLVIYIALAAIAALGTIGGMYLNTLKKIIENRDVVIKEKDLQLEKAADRINKNMLLMGDVTSLLAALNTDHKEYSKEVLSIVNSLNLKLQEDHSEIKAGIESLKG